MGRELEGWEVHPHDQRRHRLPGGDLLLLALYRQRIEEDLAGLRHGLRHTPVARTDGGLDRARSFECALRAPGGLLPGPLFGYRPDQATRRQDLAPLPRSELGRRLDERLDLGRVRTEAPRGVVVGALNPAEKSMRRSHAVNFGGHGALSDRLRQSPP